MSIYKLIPPETTANFGSIFFIGITVGLALSGFATMKLNDTQMIRLGQVLIAAGIVCMLLPGAKLFSLAGLTLIGFGCAPICPCMIHSTLSNFGVDKSQAVIGVQMASAYVGSCLMLLLFGIIANYSTVALLPVYLWVILIVMVMMHERLNRKTKSSAAR